MIEINPSHILDTIGDDVFYVTWDVHGGYATQHPEGVIWAEDGHLLLLTYSIREGLVHIRFEDDDTWFAATSAKITANSSPVSWLRCAECQRVSYTDYLCRACRATS